MQRQHLPHPRQGLLPFDELALRCEAMVQALLRYSWGWIVPVGTAREREISLTTA